MTPTHRTRLIERLRILETAAPPTGSDMGKLKIPDDLSGLSAEALEELCHRALIGVDVSDVEGLSDDEIDELCWSWIRRDQAGME